MELYVVYRNPRDYPHRYVVRRQVAHATGVEVDAKLMSVETSIEAARSAIPPDRVRLERDPRDDPCIVEIWV